MRSEVDERGLRWSLLDHVGIVWMVDLVRREIDVIDVWDQRG